MKATSPYMLVTGFAKDLDPWDGSLEVRTRVPGGSNYAKGTGGALAHDVGASVLGVGYALGICTVDVMGADGLRIVEHESQGPGC